MSLCLRKTETKTEYIPDMLRRPTLSLFCFQSSTTLASVYIQSCPEIGMASKDIGWSPSIVKNHTVLSFCFHSCFVSIKPSLTPQTPQILYTVREQGVGGVRSITGKLRQQHIDKIKILKQTVKCCPNGRWSFYIYTQVLEKPSMTGHTASKWTPRSRLGPAASSHHSCVKDHYSGLRSNNRHIKKQLPNFLREAESVRCLCSL